MRVGPWTLARGVVWLLSAVIRGNYVHRCASISNGATPATHTTCPYSNICTSIDLIGLIRRWFVEGDRSRRERQHCLARVCQDFDVKIIALQCSTCFLFKITIKRCMIEPRLCNFYLHRSRAAQNLADAVRWRRFPSRYNDHVQTWLNVSTVLLRCSIHWRRSLDRRTESTAIMHVNVLK